MFKNNHTPIHYITSILSFVGKILFRQPSSFYWEDTTVIVEYLIHADGGTVNTTHNHRWAIHTQIPGTDFYDWQNRCLSTGDVFNSFHINSIHEDESCSTNGHFSCGAELLTISGSYRENYLTRKLFTLSNLPLSGPHNVVGRSVVVYDDFGPKARGDRLACSM